MKIVCDACQAKYSISDDKVQGKVFKIRCKKCSNIIVVRGGAQASEPAPAPQEKDTRVYDYGYEGGGDAAAAGGEDAVWHLVINQDQVGPMTAAEVQQKFAGGEVDGETFCWREGFADWLPLSQVDAFASLAASGSTTHATGGGGQAAVAAMFGGGEDVGTSRSDPGDLFAAASASTSSRGHADDDDGNDLFGSKPAAASSSAAASAASTKLRGERNENSVLFSLNNLAQLASNSPAPAPVASSSSAGHATGAAGGEGSGLIDIRSMASAYLGGSAGAAAKPTSASSGIGSIDDLPVFGGGGFSEPAVIMPTVSRQRDNKILYLMIGAVGLLAIVAVVMVVILLKGNKAPQVAAAETKTTDSDKSDKDKDKDKASSDKPTGDKPADTAEAAGSAAGSGAPTGDKPADPASTGNPQTAQADKTPPKAQNAGVAAQHPAATHTESHAPTGGTHTVAQAAPKSPAGGGAPPAPKADKTADAGGGGACDEVSCVLSNYDGACCQKFRKGGNKAPAGGGGGAAAAPAGSNLPDLDRSMISSAIGAVKGKAMACGDKSSSKGMVKVHVKVDPSGHISSVSVTQTPDPALGACVQAAVQRASFPKTSQGGSFSYPFPF